MKTVVIFLFLVSTSVWASPCGKEGSVDERIKNCNLAKGGFALVVRSDKGAEFYKDQKSNLIWGNRIATDFNQYGSQKACTGEVSEYQSLNSVKWRLPTIRELEEAADHGMKAALPNMEHTYWSSTPVISKKSRRRRVRAVGVYLWDALEQKADVGDNLKDAASVRCVARE